jgi:transcriptional regulator of acetoin/glycerol metabolism
VAVAPPAPEGEEDFNLERMERALITRALTKHAWNISLAAKELGLTRASLYRRMERHGL